MDSQDGGREILARSWGDMTFARGVPAVFAHSSVSLDAKGCPSHLCLE